MRAHYHGRLVCRVNPGTFTSGQAHAGRSGAQLDAVLLGAGQNAAVGLVAQFKGGAANAQGGCGRVDFVIAAVAFAYQPRDGAHTALGQARDEAVLLAVQRIDIFFDLKFRPRPQRDIAAIREFDLCLPLACAQGVARLHARAFLGRDVLPLARNGGIALAIDDGACVALRRSCPALQHDGVGQASDQEFGRKAVEQGRGVGFGAWVRVHDGAFSGLGRALKTRGGQ